MRLTNHIVAILILHHKLQGTRAITVKSSQLCHNGLPLFVRPKLDALFDNIRGKFVLRQRQEITCDNLYDLCTILRLPMLNDMLRNVVAVLISYQHRCTLVEFFQNCRLVLGFAVLQDSLNHTTAIGMGRQGVDLSSKGIDDEPDVFGRYSLDGFLDDMIAILIFDALEDICLELLN